MDTSVTESMEMTIRFTRTFVGAPVTKYKKTPHVDYK